MFKRLFWLTVGAGFGFGMSFWIMRMARQKAERYSPANVSGEVTKAVRGLGADLKAAVSEGVEAMRDRETELREQVKSSPAH